MVEENILKNITKKGETPINEAKTSPTQHAVRPGQIAT